MSGVTFTGSFHTLDKVIDRMKKLANEGMPLVAQAIAQQMEQEIQRGFDEERTPYGVKWAPLKNPRPRRRGGLILTDTREMRDNISVTPQGGTQIEVRSPVRYSSFHNTGTFKMARRQFIPSKHGIGQIWRPGLEKAAKGAIRYIVSNK